MIPLRDASRAPVRFPVVTVGLIVVNVLAFLWEVGSDDAAIIRWAVVPTELLRGQGWITPFTAMFLHGGLMHIVSNMVFLAVFAPMVEDAMGRGTFFVFYVLGGLAATAAQIAMDPASTVPQLGASGAIAAVMGAFLGHLPRRSHQGAVVLWGVRARLVRACVDIDRAVAGRPDAESDGSGGGSRCGRSGLRRARRRRLLRDVDRAHLRTTRRAPGRPRMVAARRTEFEFVRP